MGAPKQSWGEAILTASYLINRMPIPLDTLKQSYPISNFIWSPIPPRVFRCEAFIHVHSHNRSKLDPRCVFLGYYLTQKGYKCFHPPPSKYFVSMDVPFFEDKSYFNQTSLQGDSRVEDQFCDVLPMPMP